MFFVGQLKFKWSLSWQEEAQLRGNLSRKPCRHLQLSHPEQNTTIYWHFHFAEPPSALSIANQHLILWACHSERKFDVESDRREAHTNIAAIICKETWFCVDFLQIWDEAQCVRMCPWESHHCMYVTFCPWELMGLSTSWPYLYWPF